MPKARKHHLIWNIAIAIVLLFSLSSAGQVQASGVCGTGTWTPGNLEIHHINIGQGDATLIVGPTGRSLLFDAGETSWNSSAKARIIGPYIEGVLGCRSLDYVVISHFHLDHAGYVGYGGLWHLVAMQGFSVGITLVRDYTTHLGDISGTFTNWKAYLEGVGQARLHPVIAVEGSGQVDLGTGVLFNILAVNGNGAIHAGDFHGNASPPSENDFGIGAVLSYGSFDEWIGGDLSGEYQVGGFGYSYHDIELSAAPEVGDVDVYKVNHHGSSHSSNLTFVNQLDPEVSILSVGNSNTYGHPAQAIMDRLLATSTVFMTERGDGNTNIGPAIVAGNIVIKTSNGLNFTVNGSAFTATEPVRTDLDGDGYFAEVDSNDNSSSVIPAPNGGCDPLYQTCAGSASCQVMPGQILINEVLPSPSGNGAEWVELYNSTSSTINLGYCYIDDISAGSPAYQIPASTLIPPRGFWTVDRTSYFNNTGDEVRFLKEDAATVLDSYTFGNTTYDRSWYRFPDGGNWAAASTTSLTKGQSNTIPFFPIVSSIVRADENPTTADQVNFTVKFSKAVTGVNTSAPFNDFGLHVAGISGASIAAVSGAGAMYTVTVNTGMGSGTIRLDVVDNDSIRDAGNQPLGGAGAGNGSFPGGESYTVTHQVSISGNAGAAGVTLNYTGGVTTADSNGNYSFVVASGWSGTVTPTKPNYSFSPASRTYANVTSDQVAQNYTATRLNYSISGNVGVSGVALSYSDGMPRTVISQVNGSYSLTVPGGWTGTITPSHPCFSFTPVSLSYTSLQGNQTSQDYTPSLNEGAGCADVAVWIGPSNQGRFGIPSQGSTRLSFTGLSNGPVKLISTNDTPLIGAERIIYKVNTEGTSYTELMGLPNGQLDKVYWLPWYNNVELDTQLRFANVSGSTATVHVYIGGAEMTGSPFTLAPGASTRKSFAGVNNGPVKIESDVNIVAGERVVYKVNNVNTSYTEMIGLPDNQLDTTYWLPWYNNKDFDTQLRFANVSDFPATVHIYIGGLEMEGSPFNLAVGASTRKSFPGVNHGPVKIESNVNIVAAERLVFKVNNINTSFSEMMALPNAQLDTTYWLPWYNNKDFDTQLRFANVSDTTATVHLYIGGAEMTGSPFTLEPGTSTRQSFPSVNDGPVQIVSDVPIVAAVRLIYKVNGVNTSFSEMMGLPAVQLDTTYWLPWYNNVELDTQLRFGTP